MINSVYATPAKELGKGGTDETTGKPVFVSAADSQYSVREREGLTTEEKLRFKQFQLSRTAMTMGRRDKVYEQLTNEYYTGGKVSTLVLGTPFPVIEPFPHVFDTYKAIRWYEWAASFGASFGYYAWARSRAIFRHDRILKGFYVLYPLTMSGLFLTLFATIGEARLMGLAENDHEARKYGVLDDRANLERKARNWARFAAYKEEWMRRYNMFFFNERPDEVGGLFSTCWLPYARVRYNTNFDYPARKNPYFLTTVPLKDSHSEASFIYELPRNSAGVPQVDARPELGHRYKGPLFYQDTAINH